MPPRTSAGLIQYNHPYSLAYDAAISQSQKLLKKDKEREVIEEEVRTAQARLYVGFR